MWTCSGVVTDAKGKDVGTIEIAKKFSTALGTLSIGDVAVYTAEKYTTIKFLCTVMDSTGKIVAKVHQPGLDPKKIEIVELWVNDTNEVRVMDYRGRLGRYEVKMVTQHFCKANPHY